MEVFQFLIFSLLIKKMITTKSHDPVCTGHKGTRRQYFVRLCEVLGDPL